MLPDSTEEQVIKSWETEAGPSALEEWEGSWAPRQLQRPTYNPGGSECLSGCKDPCSGPATQAPRGKKNNYPASPNPLVPIRTQGWNALVLNGAARSGPEAGQLETDYIE